MAWIPWLVIAALFAWGRPVRTDYKVVPGNEPTSGWLIQRTGKAPEVWRVRLNESGVMDEFHTPEGTWERAEQPTRWLSVCIDGIAHSEIQRLWDKGHFRQFYPPSRVISTFPSHSETALTAALRASPTPGYEHRYFDSNRNALRGGIWVTITGSGIDYLRELDYSQPGLLKGIHYVFSHQTYRADLRRLKKHYRRERKDSFIGHLASGDALCHALERDALEPLLLELESTIGELYFDARGDLGVLLFSDHGSTLEHSRPTNLKKLLKRYGWRLSRRLERPRDVVVPAYGLVGFIAVYCHDEDVAALAADLTELQGADLMIYRDGSGNGVWILSASGGQARLRWSDNGRRYWYDSRGGDPLALRSVFEKLSQEERVFSDGSVLDEQLFAATARTTYPDAAYRIRQWAINHVQNPSKIIVSLKPGYEHGSGPFRHFVNIQGTHGGLDARSSVGFAMATHPLPAVMRVEDVLRSGRGRPLRCSR